MTIPIKIYIGFDPRETIAFHVLAHSIHVRSSLPVSITPLMLDQLRQALTRERHPLQSTDFSFSRFLTPFLSEYAGWSVFMDCDMLMRDDIARLYALRDERYAVMVVKHDHVPKEAVKFLDQPQSAYQKKNWSSVMLFNNARCRALTPHYVNHASGLELHQFKWVGNDDLIGQIPARWNHLVGYDARSEDAALGPYFDEFHDCEYAQQWRDELQYMLCVEQREVNGRR